MKTRGRCGEDPKRQEEEWVVEVWVTFFFFWGGGVEGFGFKFKMFICIGSWPITK